MKKNSLLFLSIILLICFAEAQSVKEFPKDDAEFVKAYTGMLKSCTKEECKQAATWFETSFTGSKSYQYIAKIRETAQAMLDRKLLTYPHYFDFVNLLRAIDSSSVSSSTIENSIVSLKLVLLSSNTGNTKAFTSYLTYLQSLLINNAIYSSKTKNWMLNKEYQLQIENNLPVVIINNSDIIGTTPNDTLTLKNASGRYYPLENTWIGQKGTIELHRAGFNPANNYLNFNNHTINFDKSEISIDSAMFTYKPFINEPLMGTYLDKLLQAKSQTAGVPKFTSYKDDIEFNTLGKEIKLKGTFFLEGTNTYCTGTNEKNAQLSILNSKNKVVATVEALRVSLLNTDGVKASDAVVRIQLDSCEIMHPYINFSYNTKTRTIRADREVQKPLSKQPFSSDYHKMFIYADELFWNIDSSIIKLGMVGISGDNPAIFESYNYYHVGLENKYKGSIEGGPLLKIYRYYESTLDKNIDAVSIAGEINANAPFLQTEQIFYKLTEDGYIGYNNSTKVITIKEKLVNQVLASKQKQDYDNIKFASFRKYNNAKLNINNYEMEVYGVDQVRISDKSEVKFIPSSDTIKIYKNRNMQVGGRIIAGKVDFVSPKLDFEYDPFVFNLNKIDSMIVYIPEGSPNEKGEVMLVRSGTPIHNLSGTLYVAEADNKSGTRNNLKYPYFSSKDTANTYYDKGKNGDKYDKNLFKFNITPFEIDSLTVTATENLDLKGSLISGGIFEPIKTQLIVQEDKSLGSDIQTTNKGLKLYGKESKYFSSLTLTNDGLSGKGDFAFGSATLYADTAFFFIDSTYSVIDSLRIVESKQFDMPNAYADNLILEWSVKNDSAVITPKDKKILMFNNTVTLNGNLIMRGNDLNGVGVLEWGKTTLASNDISFKAKSFNARNGQLNLTNEQGTSLLKSNDVNAFFDLDRRVVDIELNKNDTIPLEAFKYIANPKYLKFDLVQNTLQLKAPSAITTFFLQSTDPVKELLTFETNSADLNLNDNTIHFGGIKELKLADSKVLPNKDEIYIESDGSVRDLVSSAIIFNADSAYHKVNNANIHVISRNNFTGSGAYTYKSIDGLLETIKIQEIAVNTSYTKEVVIQEGKKKTKQTVTDEGKIYTYAKTEILESDKFKLNDKVFYKGNVYFDSRNPNLELEGFVKIVLKSVATDWIPLKQSINPKHPEVSIDSVLANAPNLVNGLLYDRMANEFYPNILQEKRAEEDAPTFAVKGNMSFNPKDANELIFGNEIAFVNPFSKKSGLKYNEQTKKITGAGTINFGINLGDIKLSCLGGFEYNNNQNLEIAGDLAIYTPINTGVANNIINQFIGLDSSFKFISYKKNTQIQNTIGILTQDSIESKMVMMALKHRDSLYMPSSISHNLILSGTKFFWDAQDASFKSVGTINLPYFGTNNIVKKTYKAYIEIGYGQSGDFVNILLENKSGAWLYIRFKKGQMGMTCTNPEVFSYIVALPEALRTVKNGKYYSFELLPADNVLKEDYLIRMQDFYERFKAKIEPPIAPK